MIPVTSLHSSHYTQFKLYLGIMLHFPVGLLHILSGSLPGHRLNPSSQSKVQSVEGKSNPYLCTRAARSICCSIIVMFLPTQACAPALKGMNTARICLIAVSSSSNHRSGRYVSGFEKTAGSRLATYAGIETMVSPGISSPTICIPWGGVRRSRPLVRGGERRSDSSKQAFR